MNKKANPDAPVFSELHTLMEQADRKPCAMLIPDTLDAIAQAILDHKGRMAEECWIIGKLLIAAKEKLTEHGEWLSWLADNVDIPDWQAERYMKLAREYPNPTALSILGQTKALEVTKIPEPEREEFLQATHPVDGQEKTVAQMTTRELEKVVREWKEPQPEALDDDESFQFPVFRSSRGRVEDDPEDTCWDNKSREKLLSELEAMQTQLQPILEHLKSMALLGNPGERCADKLRAIYSDILNCLQLAKVDI